MVNVQARDWSSDATGVAKAVNKSPAIVTTIVETDIEFRMCPRPKVDSSNTMLMAWAF
jgi:hypothetical protein